MDPVGKRAAAFWMVTASCAAALALFLYFRQETPGSSSQVVSDPAAPGVASLVGTPHVILISTDSRNYNRLTIASLENRDERHVTPTECDRVDFAGGIGVCLSQDEDVLTTYSALVLDRSLSTVLHRIPLDGVPSRVRVAPDGSVAAVTVFASGHSYAGGGYSTKTTIIDTRAGEALVDLEQIDVERNGKLFASADFNFWGVTFLPDSDGFLATLGSGGVFYLVKGSVKERTLDVVGTGVECPSLSPDGTRIAYKKRSTVRSNVTWRLAVRTLATGADRVIEGETRSIDDQVEWLDDRQILYGVTDAALKRSSVWVVGVDGGAAAQWLADGLSPSVQQ